MSYHDSELSQFFYDPQFGLYGIDKLYKKLPKDLNISKKKLKEWLEKQHAVQLHMKRPTINNYFPIKSAYRDHIWQADLMDVSRDSHDNQGINFLLCVLDIFTRYAWVSGLKNKSAVSVTKAFKEILSTSKRSPKILSSDNGTEFTNNTFQNLLKAFNIESSFNEPGDHHRMGIIERFNKTLRGLIEKYKSATQQNTWIPVLDKLVYNYNHTWHSTLKTSPAKATDEILENIVEKEKKAKEELKTFDLGDQVRYLTNPKMFDKGSLPKWSPDYYYIKKIEPKRYKLSNDRWKKYYELLKLPDGGVQYGHVLPSQPSDIQRKSERLALRKEGVEPMENIITLNNATKGTNFINSRPLRSRKPQSQLISSRGERIIF